MNFKEIILSHIYSKSESENLFKQYSDNNVLYVNGRFYTGDNLNKFRGVMVLNNLLESITHNNLKYTINKNGSLTLTGDNFHFEEVLPYPTRLIENIVFSVIITGVFNDDTFTIGLRNNQKGLDSSLLNGGLNTLFSFTKNNSRFILNGEVVENTSYTESILKLDMHINQNPSNDNYKVRYKLYSNNSGEWVKIYNGVKQLTIPDLDYGSFSVLINHQGVDKNTYLTINSLNCDYNTQSDNLLGTSLTLSSQDWVKYKYNSNLEVHATLKDANNLPLPNQNILLDANNNLQIIEETNNNGVAVFNVPITSKEDIVLTGVFEENDNYLSSQATRTVSVGASVTLVLENIEIT